MAENFMAETATCSKGHKYLVNHQSADCPHERFVDKMPDTVKPHFPSILGVTPEEKPDDRLLEELIVIMKEKEKDLKGQDTDIWLRRKLERVIAKTASIIQNICPECDDGWKDSEYGYRVRCFNCKGTGIKPQAERLDRPDREKIEDTYGVIRDEVDQILALIPDVDKVVGEIFEEIERNWQDDPSTFSFGVEWQALKSRFGCK